ncbi:hypothetical protein ACVWW7_006882 [Bradyrhizobium sp. LM6.9]
MRQSLHFPWTNLDVDDRSAPVIAVRVDVIGTKAEVPDHRHRKGQLIFALGGGVTCRVPNGLWMVPPHCAVWVPGGMQHSNLATENARLFFVYIEPDVVDLPDRCCTLSISPLLREVIVELSDQIADDEARVALLASVLLRELPHMPVQQLHLPLSPEPRLKKIAAALAKDPSDRRTLAEWAHRVALSESSLARLVVKDKNGAELRALASAIAPDRRLARTHLRRQRAAGFGRPRLRVGRGLHHDVQEGAREAAGEISEQYLS